MTKPIVVTGAASGLGAAIVDQLRAEGRPALGVDRLQADIIADLGTEEGRAHAVAEVERLADGAIDGLVSCAATSPIGPDPANVLSVNYFGALAMLDDLLGCLVRGEGRSAVAITSIGAAAGPFDDDLVAVVLSGDEQAARTKADDGTDYRSAIAYNCAKVGGGRRTSGRGPTQRHCGRDRRHRGCAVGSGHIVRPRPGPVRGRWHGGPAAPDGVLRATTPPARTDPALGSPSVALRGAPPDRRSRGPGRPTPQKPRSSE